VVPPAAANGVREVCPAAELEAGKTTLAKAPFGLGKGTTATVTLKPSKASLPRISRKGTKVTLELTGRHVVVRTTVKKP
jgi:hypothetical protein